MALSANQIQEYLALLQAAAPLGKAILEGVKSLLHRNLTPVDLQAVLAQWDDNVVRSAHNAGLDSKEGDQ